MKEHNTNQEKHATRRRFIQQSALLSAGVMLSSGSNSPLAQSRDDGMIYRTLGRTGERVSVIGLGGWHIGQPSFRTRVDAAYSPGHRPRHDLHGQLLGLQRRREPSPHGQGPEGWLPPEGLLDGQDRRPDEKGRRRADRPVPPAPPNRRHRPAPAPRGHPAGGPGPHLRRGRSTGGGAGRAEGGEGPFHRLYRPQGPVRSPADA